RFRSASYVPIDQRQSGYQLTALVSSLSSGYHGDPLVIEAGRPWAIQLTRQLHWPVSIAVLDVDTVVVRLSTVADSPVSPFHSTINMHLSLFTKALGRAYLAFCDDDEIEDFARRAESSPDPMTARIAGDRDYLYTLVRSIRRSGYALRDARAEPRNSNTLAVPILLGGRVRASLGMTFFRSAVKSTDLYRGYAAKLKQVSAQITAGTERLREAYSPAELPRVSQARSGPGVGSRRAGRDLRPGPSGAAPRPARARREDRRAGRHPASDLTAPGGASRCPRACGPGPPRPASAQSEPCRGKAGRRASLARRRIS